MKAASRAYKVAVVGSGPAGQAAALFLARKGHHVHVLLHGLCSPFYMIFIYIFIIV